MSYKVQHEELGEVLSLSRCFMNVSALAILQLVLQPLMLNMYQQMVHIV